MASRGKIARLSLAAVGTFVAFTVVSMAAHHRGPFEDPGLEFAQAKQELADDVFRLGDGDLSTSNWLAIGRELGQIYYLRDRKGDRLSARDRDCANLILEGNPTAQSLHGDGAKIVALAEALVSPACMPR